MKKIIIIILLISWHNLCADWKQVGKMDLYDPVSGIQYGMKWLDIECYDDFHCFALGTMQGPVTMKSSDGGNTWQHSLLDTNFINEDGSQHRFHYPYDMDYPNGNLCIITCDSAYYWLSKDSLKNWDKKRVKDTNYRITNVSFIDDKIGFMSLGTELYKTQDGAESFYEIKINFPDSLRKVFDQLWIDEIITINEKILYVTIAYFRKGTIIIKTIDGGLSWKFYPLNNKISSSNILFFNENEGLTYFLDYNNPDKRFQILKTTDAGYTWITLLDTTNRKKGDARAIKFINRNVGYALGDYYSLWKTTDGGITWNMKEDYYWDLSKKWMWRFDIINESEIVGLAYPGNQEIYKYSENPSNINSKNEKNMLIYPNPATTDTPFFLEILSEEQSVCNISIYNVSGFTLIDIDKINLNKGKNRFSYSESLIPGIYFVKVNLNGYITILKLIVQ